MLHCRSRLCWARYCINKFKNYFSRISRDEFRQSDLKKIIWVQHFSHRHQQQLDPLPSFVSRVFELVICRDVSCPIYVYSSFDWVLILSSTATSFMDSNDTLCPRDRMNYIPTVAEYREGEFVGKKVCNLLFTSFEV